MISELLTNLLNAFQKPCPSCNKNMTASYLIQEAQASHFSCPHCSSTLKISLQERQLSEVSLYSICLFLGITVFSILPIILQVASLLAIYRLGILAQPLYLPFKKVQKKSTESFLSSWKKMVSSFLKRQCPNCEHSISWAQRSKMRSHLMMKCPSCTKILRVHPRDQLINAVLLGWFIHNMTEMLFGRQMLFFEIFAYLTIASTPFWRSFDSLFSLIVWPQSSSAHKNFL